jgi:hypothetical protein
VSAEPFVSYAHNHEDVVLARALCPSEHTGFWIDVGAGDPVVGSVTAAFAERGWRGINVEPRPAEYARLCESRPDDVNLQSALGAATALADFVAEHAPPAVDFLRIHAVGLERDVLDGVALSHVNPRIVVVRVTDRSGAPAERDPWETIVLDHGYRFAMFDGSSRFYASADEPGLLDALGIPANVHDAFVPYLWECRVETARDAMREAVARARHQGDRTAIALEEIAALRDELDAAQRLAARALDRLVVAQAEEAEARSLLEQEREQSARAAADGARRRRWRPPFRGREPRPGS